MDCVDCIVDEAMNDFLLMKKASDGGDPCEHECTDNYPCYDNCEPC